jgi:pantoate--beta-alanine ligase
MIIFKQVKDIRIYIDKEKKAGKVIGFVPTMGALHNGHLSLIEASSKGSKLTVCSIFVNPSQFNNKEDFKKYPITLESDIEKLVTAGCDLLFLPSEREIYPENYQPKHFEVGQVENILEGYYRPGHFQGVCQVVDRLLDIVQPNNLYMGQKDFQQCIVIKKLLALTGKESVQLIISPTVREESGLAMSSRNMRLSGEEKKNAVALYESLSWMKDKLSNYSIADLKGRSKELLVSKGFVVDYVEILDAATLSVAATTDAPIIAVIAATLHDVRLIDNMLLN